MTESKISIAIVTWNREEELKRSLESIFIQTYPPKEVIIVDNHSDYSVTDSLCSIKERMESNGIDFKLIRTHKNIGCPMARNIAFSNCVGEYIYALDDDGWLDKLALEQCIKVFEMIEHDRTIVVASSVVCPQTLDVLTNKSNGIERKNIFSAGAALYRRQYLEEYGYFPDYFRQMEESHFSMKAYGMKKEIFINDKSIMFHDKTPKGRSKYLEVKSNFLNEIKNIASFMKPVGIYIVFLYKAYAHFRSYFKSGYLFRFPRDFVKSLIILFSHERKGIMSFKDYRKFTSGVLNNDR